MIGDDFIFELKIGHNRLVYSFSCLIKTANCTCFSFSYNYKKILKFGEIDVILKTQ